MGNITSKLKQSYDSLNNYTFPDVIDLLSTNKKKKEIRKNEFNFWIMKKSY